MTRAAKSTSRRAIASSSASYVFSLFPLCFFASPGRIANPHQVSAAKDPNYFPCPETVNPRRNLSSYIFYGKGPHACLGEDASRVALVELFRAVFRRKNVRRVPGPQGELKKVKRPGNFYAYMTEDWGTLSPFPVSMKIMWDD